MKHIAAIEIGSSRIKGIVAAVEEDGKMKVLAIEESPAGDAVRYGRVKNAREASELINNIVRRLENSPRVAPGRISTVFIADGGRSLSSSPSDGTLNFEEEKEITHGIVERLHKDARFNLASERDVLAIVPKRFLVDASEVKKNVVGYQGRSVRGEFTIITQAPENRRALERLIIESNGEDVKRDYITRILAQTEMALTDSDREVGSVFVDFGSETTTVAAFREGVLVFAATLPIGAANITHDLSAALAVTDEKAENIKRIKGQAVVDRTKFDAPDDEVSEIVNYVSARAGEIIANVSNLLEQAGFRPADFPGGLVITGGGTRLKGFPEMVEALTKMKTRIAETDRTIEPASPGLSLAENFDVVSLARYAATRSKTDCVTYPKTSAQTTTETEATNQAQPEETKTTTTDWMTRPGRRSIREDDPNLLRDDEDDVQQPDNVINDDDSDELPPQEKDANTTRLNLVAKLKQFGKIFTARPFEEVDTNDMD